MHRSNQSPPEDEDLTLSNQVCVIYGHEILPNRPKIICRKEQCIREIWWKLSISFQVPSNFREVPTRSLCCQLHLLRFFQFFVYGLFCYPFIVCVCVCSAQYNVYMYVHRQSNDFPSFHVSLSRTCMWNIQPGTAFLYADWKHFTFP